MEFIKVSVCLLLSCAVFRVSSVPCEEQLDKYTRRLGKTRFYIVQQNGRGGFHSFLEAKEECKLRNLKMAKINNMRTMAVVGRELEKVVTENKLQDTWYWLDASYNQTEETYVWNRAQMDGEVKPVMYSVFLYRSPRPTGVGSFVNYRGRHYLEHSEPQCLTLALPWPSNWEMDKRKAIFGHHAIIDEKPCNGKKGRHAICESENNNCRYYDDNPFVLTESKVGYFEEGLWIFGDRKYLVNWKHQTFEESKKFCEMYGLEVFSPGVDETDLIPFIKMWSREITVSQFWTALKYAVGEKTFDDPSGQAVFRKKGHQEFSHVGKRSNKMDAQFCVAMSHSYEFQEQLYCPDGAEQYGRTAGSPCQWSFVDYIPANCNNHLGTICQHVDKNERKMEWKADYVKNVTAALMETAMTQEFGYVGNTDFLRSKYKQTYGILYCPKGYRMLREETTGWEKRPEGVEDKKIYKYDYNETYWVVGDLDFYKNSNDSCQVSVPTMSLKDGMNGDGHTRKIMTVMCTEWHFYICEKITTRYVPLDFKPQPQEEMKWGVGSQPRKYPLYSNGMLIRINLPL